jgi:hypothetical protein
VNRRFAPTALLAALPVALLAAIGAALARLEGSADPPHHNASVMVGSEPVSRPLPSGFVGLSFEYTAVERYAGRDPGRVDPVLIRLIRGLSPGQRPVLRIGGNSTDTTWWPEPGESAPRGGTLALNDRWLQTTAALAAALDARVILGLNLAGGRPAVAADEAGAFRRGIGSRYIDALEIGNEPDLYGLFPWPQDRNVYRRPPGYGLNDYLGQFSEWRAAIGRELPVTGPAYATFDWSLARFIRAEPGLSQVTFHHYPLDACLTDPSAAGYPTISSLLSDQSSGGLAQRLAASVATAHAHGVTFRLDELNSASCMGKWGVSNTFASALWMLDTLFSLARVGVDGVNVHTLPNAAYEPFTLYRTTRGWRASVAPEYYGMLLFAEADPAEARLLRVSVSARGALRAWASRGPGSVTHVVLINKNIRKSYEVGLRVRGRSDPAQLTRLTAPSPSSTAHVALAGRSFGPSGRLRGAPHIETVAPDDGVYSIRVPADSVVLVTL